MNACVKTVQSSFCDNNEDYEKWLEIYNWCRDRLTDWRMRQLREFGDKILIDESPDPQWRIASKYRSLLNTSLFYLLQSTHSQDRKCIEMALSQFHEGRNMTEIMGALSSIIHSTLIDQESLNIKNQVLQMFYDNFQDNDLVLQKWLRMNATIDHPDTIQQSL